MLTKRSTAILAIGISFFLLQTTQSNAMLSQELCTLIAKKNISGAQKLLKTCIKKDVSDCLTSALVEAATHGIFELFEPLIAKGANINKRTGYKKWTPLKYAVAWAPRKLRIATVSALLYLGADPNSEDSEGLTPFIEACSWYFYTPQLIRAFFDKDVKIKPDLQKHKGVSPLFYLLALQKNPSLDLINLFLENDADPDEMDIDGLTPAEYVKKYQNGKPTYPTNDILILLTTASQKKKLKNAIQAT